MEQDMVSLVWQAELKVFKQNSFKARQYVVWLYFLLDIYVNLRYHTFANESLFNKP